MTITLRDATSADALCLSALGMQVFLDTYATQGIRQSIAREALEAFSPANFAQLLIEPTTFIVVAELQRLYVQERFTGRGAGRLLLEAAERRATILHASLLWATVWVGNPRALAFYPRQGYEWNGTPHYVFQGETHENHLFAKPLMTTD